MAPPTSPPLQASSLNVYLSNFLQDFGTHFINIVSAGTCMGAGEEGGGEGGERGAAASTSCLLVRTVTGHGGPAYIFC